MTQAITQPSKIITTPDLSPELQKLLDLSTSESSKKAKISDLKVYCQWSVDVPPLPANDVSVSEFIACMAKTRTVSTITRYISTLSRVHEMANWPNPTKSELVSAALGGLRRSKNVAPNQAPALRGKDLIKILKNMSKIEWTEKRNRAIFTIGWTCALRCSELCSLNLEDIEIQDKGILLNIRTSKTDQLGKGCRLGIPLSPLTVTISDWISELKILYKSDSGPLFPRFSCRAVDKYFPPSGIRPRLSIRGMSKTIRSVLLSNGFKGSVHSLRRGMITEAANVGVPELIIQRHSRHASISVLRSYVEDGNILEQNPLPAIFDRLFGGEQNL